ncbi:MAG: LytR family transcriptional regulator, partial [Mycobacterium sp.]
ASISPGSVRVVLADDYTGPGSGLDGTDVTLSMDDPSMGYTQMAAAAEPSPIITAGSNDPACVN